MRSFAKIKLSRNNENSLFVSDEGTCTCKSYRSRDFLRDKYAFNHTRENKISGKFPNLQYCNIACHWFICFSF